MLTLRILSGTTAGREIAVSRFPFSIGRERSADLSSQEPGVWEQHARIELDPKAGFRLGGMTSAPVLIDGEPSQGSPLRNGAVLTLGGLRIACWLSSAEHKSLFAGEALTWLMIAAVFVAELVLLLGLLASQ